MDANQRYQSALHREAWGDNLTSEEEMEPAKAADAASSTQTTTVRHPEKGLFHKREPQNATERVNAQIPVNDRTKRGRRKSPDCMSVIIMGVNPRKLSARVNDMQDHYRCIRCLHGFEKLSALRKHWFSCVNKWGNPDGKCWDDHHTCAFPDEHDYTGPPPA